MSDPLPINVYSVTLLVNTATLLVTATGTTTQQTQKQLNVLAETLQNACDKAVATTPNSTVRQGNLICVVNVQ